MSDIKKTKLYKILASLSKKEFDQLELYLSSPLFLKNNQDVFCLFSFLKKYWKELSEKGKSKRFFFELVYPDLPFKDLKMRHLLSKSVKLVDNYLLYLEHEENDLEREIRITNIYNKRNIYSEFVNNSKRLLNNLDRKKNKDVLFYFQKYTLERNYFFNPKTNKSKSTSYIKNALESFHNYIALEYSNLELEIVNQKRIFSEPIHLPNLTYNPQLTANNKTLSIIKNAIQLLVKGEENNFFQLKELWEKHISILAFDDKVNTFLVLTNYAMQQMSKNPQIFNSSLLFDLYKIGVAQKVLLLNGEIHPIAYLNIVMTSLKSQTFIWTEKFIDEYSKNLPKEVRFSTEQLALGYLNFAQKNYREVIHILSKESLFDIKLAINVRTLLLRSYFYLFQSDNSYYQPFLKNCASFDKFLQREKKLIAGKKKSNRNFIKYIRRIANNIYRRKWNYRRKMEIIEELKEDKEVSLNAWLLEVITLSLESPNYTKKA